jgi:hypothetical protein
METLVNFAVCEAIKSSSGIDFLNKVIAKRLGLVVKHQGTDQSDYGKCTIFKSEGPDQ